MDFNLDIPSVIEFFVVSAKFLEFDKDDDGNIGKWDFSLWLRYVMF